MAELSTQTQRLHKTALVVLALAITLLFLWMISDFLMALLLAAIGTGIFHPLHERLTKALGGRRRIAAALTVLVVLLLIVIPATAFAGLVATEALHLSQVAVPWVGDQFAHPGELTRIIERYPSLTPLLQYRGQIVEKLSELASMVGGVVMDALAVAARETLSFFLLLFVTLYALFFFLLDGRRILWKILYYFPLTASEESRMVERFLSVSRATIKGTIAMGCLQGALGGVAFWVFGVPSPALWGTIMAFLSALPGVGSALVWLPASAFLLATGHGGAALGLALFCAGFVGTLDNFLRPRLIGKDAQMSDLLILLATLGGIVFFGIAGFILGPIVGALFVTVWDIYGEAFRDVLPEGTAALLTPRPGKEDQKAPSGS